MALNLNSAKKSNKPIDRVEDGAYPARIVQIIDFGEQYETDYKTGEVKTYEDSGAAVIRPKVWINFEFPTETIEIDGEAKPRWYGKEYTLSSHEKSALFALLKSADPKGEATNKWRNVAGLLSLPVMVTIGSTSSGKAKVASVSAVPKGLPVGELVNTASSFDLDGNDREKFDSLPDWMKERIKGAINFNDTKFSKSMMAASGDY